MNLTCPECKNDVVLARYPNLKRDDVIECDTCGISLLITDTSGDQLVAEVADEGK